MISNEQLKYKILYDAFHGMLINNGCNIKDTKLLNYKSKSELFNIPKNWKWINLDFICSLIFLAPSPKYSKEENKNFCLGQKNNQSYGIDLIGLKINSTGSSIVTIWQARFWRGPSPARRQPAAGRRHNGWRLRK